MAPKIGKRRDHRRRKSRGSRGHRKRGSGKRKNIIEHPRGERYINLAVNQKSVSRPTLRHRNWMEKQKGENLSTADIGSAPLQISGAELSNVESLTISKIESSLPPLRGATASFSNHINQRRASHVHLDAFYNGKNFHFKKYKYMSKKARMVEFHRVADSLLRMVGGSIGEKRREDQKVVIGVGLGDFTSTSRLTSLHGTFEAFFIQK
ncbi:hypothetical protein FBU30_003314, partial [Linnemannia zychae]